MATSEIVLLTMCINFITAFFPRCQDHLSSKSFRAIHEVATGCQALPTILKKRTRFSLWKRNTKHFQIGCLLFSNFFVFAIQHFNTIPNNLAQEPDNLNCSEFINIKMMNESPLLVHLKVVLICLWDLALISNHFGETWAYVLLYIMKEKEFWSPAAPICMVLDK